MGFWSNIFGRKNLSSIARKAGYVKDQMGIQNRYVREHDNWASHLENTKKYILESAKEIQTKKSVAILGSGWLFDVPYIELSQMFDDVYLYDIVHPEQVIVKTRKINNIHLVICDLTGNAVQLAEEAKSFDDFIKRICSISPEFNFLQYDLVVSVNLLNQLDIMLCDYIEKKFSVSEDQLKKVRQLVQQRHIDYLPKGKTCLITDYIEENTSLQDGSVSAKQLLYCTIPQWNGEREWIWNFDTNQMYHKEHNTVMKVRALRF